MNESPFVKAVQDKLRHHCESCRHFRLRRSTDKPGGAGYEHARHHCLKLDMATFPQALRCGGDDWEAAHAKERLTISIDRACKSWAVLDAHFTLLRSFSPYTNEAEALAEAKAWVAERSSNEPDIAYPQITRMSASVRKKL